MQSGEWRHDSNCSNYMPQQQPSTAFCIDNILGKPSVNTDRRNAVSSSPYGMEQSRLHNSYRTANYPLMLPARAYHNPFMPYQRHHPYAMPMAYNIQAPMIPSIYDAFHDPMGLWNSLLDRHQRKKGGQVRFSNEQTVELEKTFEKQKYLSPPERKQIAKMLQLSERQIKTWFQNRRAKWRRLKQEGRTNEENDQNTVENKQIVDEEKDDDKTDD